FTENGKIDPSRGETFSFGECTPGTLEFVSRGQAMEAWRAISSAAIPHAFSLAYYLSCTSSPDLPATLTTLCDVPLLKQRGGHFSMRQNESVRAVGTHLELQAGRPNHVPIGQDGGAHQLASHNHIA